MSPDRGLELEAAASQAGRSGDHARAASLWLRALASERGERCAYLAGAAGSALLYAGDIDQAILLLTRSCDDNSRMPPPLGSIVYGPHNLLWKALLYSGRYEELWKHARRYWGDTPARSGGRIASDALVEIAERSVDLASAGVVDLGPIGTALRLAEEEGCARELRWAILIARPRAAEALGDREKALSLYRDLIRSGCAVTTDLAPLRQISQMPALRVVVLLEDLEGVAAALAEAESACSLIPPGHSGRYAPLVKLRDDLRGRRPHPPAPKHAPTRGEPTPGEVAASPGSLLALMNIAEKMWPAETVALLDLSARLIVTHVLRDGRQYDPERVLVDSLGEGEQDLLGHCFAPAAIEGRGYWGVPEACRDGALSVYRWAVLDPLYAALKRPAATQASLSSVDPVTCRADLWPGLAEFFRASGHEPRLIVDVGELGGGWHLLDHDERTLVKKEIQPALERWVLRQTYMFWALELNELAATYYQNSRGGIAESRKVLDRETGRRLVHCFLGDWVVLLRAFGERPAPKEVLFSAMPSAPVLLGGAYDAVAAAATLGINEGETKKIVDSLWGGAAASPVLERAAALERLWGVFDQTHRRRTVTDGPADNIFQDPYAHLSDKYPSNSIVDQEDLEEALPEDVRLSVRRLWGRTVLINRKEVLVSNPCPLLTATKTMGPAFHFWHQLSIIAWNNAGGSRLTAIPIDQAEDRLADAASEMAALGTPVDITLFERIAGVLAPHNPGNDDVNGREDTFIRTNALLSKYRREWSDKFIGVYLKSIAARDVRTASEAYYRLLAEKGTEPSAARFGASKIARTVSISWFGGDLSALAHAIGVVPPAQPSRAEPVMPSGLSRFLKFTIERLMAEAEEPPLPDFSATTGADWHYAAPDLVVHWLQLCEALGREPTLNEVGRQLFLQATGVRQWRPSRIDHYLLGEDARDAYESFCRVVRAALGTPSASLSPGGADVRTSVQGPED